MPYAALPVDAVVTTPDPTSSAERRTVLIWRRTWLPASETFIRQQMKSMTRWRPVAAGLYRHESPLSSPADDVYFDHMLKSRLGSRIREDLCTGRAVRAAIRAHQPDVIHVHFLRDALRVVPVAIRCDIPTIVTVHGFDITRWPKARAFPEVVQPMLRWRRRRAARRTLRGADRVIAVSEMLRSRVMSFGGYPSRTSILPIGVEVPQTDPRRQRDRSGVVFVGRLVEVKGVADLLQAWAALPHALRDEHPLTVVGDGPLRSELEQLADSLDVTVDFRGAQPQAQVFEALSEAAVFCGPSRTAAAGDTEGFGIVFLEAAAHALPVVAYQHGGVPEAVVDGFTGLLAPEADVRALSEHLERLLSDSALRDEMGRAALARVKREFDVAACTAQLEDIYDDVSSSTS